MKENYKKFIDPNIKRKSEIIQNSLQYDRNNKVPLFSLVEISDSGTCNRACSFCPRSDKDWINEFDNKEFIKSELHESIVSQLQDLNYNGIVVYSGFNEPLLNKEIYKNITQTRSYLPGAKIELITNGDVLNEKRLLKLFEAGLSTLLISVYDGPEDMIKFEKMCNNVKLEKDQYVIRKRYLPPEENFGITMSNRGGLMENAEHSVPSLKKSLNTPCFYPSYTLFIDYNGDVLMCSHDWGKKNILGNLNKEKIMDVWLSNNAMMSRKNLSKGNREFSPCNVCDAGGTLIGKKHVEAWEKI
ncbi:SPASM domain-containing protein [Pelagibacterales bacterium SAG-MED37]|nr:SPASM domain-containing protein [Pelagibacterales bacterium SAG-MED37]